MMLQKKEGLEDRSTGKASEEVRSVEQRREDEFPSTEEHVIKQDWGVIRQVTFESVERTESEKTVRRRLDESLRRVRHRCCLEDLRDKRSMRDS